jgi:hypothetical protein
MKDPKNLRRSSITYFIDRVAEGNNAYQDRLCQRLADRLLHIPLQAENSKQTNGDEVSISVQKVKVGGVSAVPVFTKKNLIENWEKQIGQKSESITLIGADFCKVLEPELSLLVDPGSEAQIVIEPELIKRIIAYGDEALITEFGNVKETAVIELDQVIEQPVTTKEPENQEPEQSEDNTQNKDGLRNWLGINK